MIIAGIAGQTSEVFLKQPSSSPYYVREGEEGPTLECTLAQSFRGDNHEVQWIRYTKGLPRYGSLNGLEIDIRALEAAHIELQICSDLKLSQKSGKPFSAFLQSIAMHNRMTITLTLFSLSLCYGNFLPVLSSRHFFGSLDEACDLMRGNVRSVGWNPDGNIRWISRRHFRTLGRC